MRIANLPSHSMQRPESEVKAPLQTGHRPGSSSGGLRLIIDSSTGTSFRGVGFGGVETTVDCSIENSRRGVGAGKVTVRFTDSHFPGMTGRVGVTGGDDDSTGRRAGIYVCAAECVGLSRSTYDIQDKLASRSVSLRSSPVYALIHPVSWPYGLYRRVGYVSSPT